MRSCGADDSARQTNFEKKLCSFSNSNVCCVGEGLREISPCATLQIGLILDLVSPEPAEAMSDRGALKRTRDNDEDTTASAAPKRAPLDVCNVGIFSFSS